MQWYNLFITIIINNLILFFINIIIYLQGGGRNSNGLAMGFIPPGVKDSEKDQNVPFNPAAFSYNIPLDNANSNNIVCCFLSSCFYSFLNLFIRNLIITVL